MKSFCYIALIIVWLLSTIIGAAAFYAAMADKKEVAGNIGIGLVLFVAFVAIPVTAAAGDSLQKLEEK